MDTRKDVSHQYCALLKLGKGLPKCDTTQRPSVLVLVAVLVVIVALVLVLVALVVIAIIVFKYT